MHLAILHGIWVWLIYGFVTLRKDITQCLASLQRVLCQGPQCAQCKSLSQKCMFSLQKWAITVHQSAKVESR